MFTGLIADKARVVSISRGAESAVIEIESVLIPEIKTGDSVSINGTCLTAIELSGGSFKADVMIQTLKVTSLGKLSEGDFVNLELATRADSRLGGHIVQGHVDGIGSIVENSVGEKWNKFVVKVPNSLTKYIVNQGSIAIDGVSLTVGEISDDLLTLWLIPETLERTNLSQKSDGDIVNIEVDVIAKYVERLMNRGQ
ncbi:MAG: riboflavin synthase [Candidatus Nanopelagicaceae bacterium]|jgi:riboflavin synthase|nr:MAG: riboflavin synthase subunit alpha [Actinobacteria bacterium BACL2 MAG-120507-bin38]MDP4615457.1 riboflavin synthase [Candidatus Nanopelagicales bacterium]MDP4864839.1 riboflavin synthase [Candidatus Nanopelagicaceae bacterium]HAG54356.1 riboflavin synthase [Actinomycetota bacterium]MDP4653110.1 riboflavin synthase [Candidatus Nanopelagicales bacterium]